MDVPFRRARKAFGIASISLFGAEGGAWAQQTPTPTPPTLPEVRVRDADDAFKTDATKAVTRTATSLTGSGNANNARSRITGATPRCTSTWTCTSRPGATR